MKYSGNVNCSGSDASLALVKKPGVTITPDESIAEVKKEASNFDHQKAAFWGKGKELPFIFTVKGLDAISEESRQVVKMEIMCNMLRTMIETTPEDLVKAVYLLDPAHEGLELGIGEASIVEADAEVSGFKEDFIKSKSKELGHLGLAAKACHSSQRLICKPEGQIVARVFDAFPDIALGVKTVKQVYSVIPVCDKRVSALLAGGVWYLRKTCSFAPGVPVEPMLAKSTKGVSEILDKFQDMEFTCKYKYDGEHAQIHYMENGSVELYS